MPRRNHLKRRGLSRRQMIQRLTILGVVGAGGVAAGLLRDRPQVVVLPYGDGEPDIVPAAERPAIVSREEWGALPVNHSARSENGYYKRGTNPEGWYLYGGDLHDSYQTLIVHHSAFYESDGLATLLEVQRLHREDRKWADIGYHFLVDVDGTIYEGRDLGVRGVHTFGHNTGSVGVCLLGDFRFRAPSAEQLQATIAVGRWLVEQLTLTHLAGHSQFNESTVCPGAEILKRLPDLAEMIGVEYGADGYVPTARSGHDCDCHAL